MDEKRSDSSPVNDAAHEHTETPTTNRTLDAPMPEETPVGGWSFVTQAHYDPADSRELTTVIIDAIADAEDVPIVEVKTPPLYEVVDIPSIESALFDHDRANEDGTTSTVEFRYNQYKVSVESDGWVTVTDRTDRPADDEP